ncbi:hypothetical protein MSAN_00323200 [Mycena sanguinolenta]|uniref:Ankyrin n=1 Tax=Mycena sanguinolenta TaxID=230812 RepID=A0A8H6ZBK3_9AGAR|nr:hypothetical protein MSAN_00323200 [Mycena sanguinolenta]
MGRLTDLPPELLLRIISFLPGRELILGPMRRLPGGNPQLVEPILVPDLSSINALAQTNRALYNTLNQSLYRLCASVKSVGRLALLFAVKHDLGGAFDQLFAAGVNIYGPSTFKYNSSCSLLHVAADAGSCLVISQLLEVYGEEMLEVVYTHDANGWTALDYAALGGHTEAVRLLTSIVAVPSFICDGEVDSGAAVADEFLEAREEYLRWALLKSVARTSNAAICKHLISEGVDVNTRDINLNASPLFYASGNNNLAAIQVLLAAGADPNLGDRDGIMPLFEVASIPAAEALLAAGADIHATDMKARNVLAHRPVESPEMLRFILERGVNPNHQDNEGRDAAPPCV